MHLILPTWALSCFDVPRHDFLYIFFLYIPRSAGGVNITAPSRIFSIPQKRQQKSTRNFQYLIRHQFDVFRQNLRKICGEFIWENDILVTSSSAILGEKAANVCRLLAQSPRCIWNVHVWSKTQPVNAKRRKIERATIWLSRIFDIFWFWPPKLKILIFQK